MRRASAFGVATQRAMLAASQEDALHSEDGYVLTFAEKHPGVLSSWDGDSNEATPAAMTVMISGARPSAQHLFQRYPQRRLAILDGREGDLDADYPLSFMPVISKVCLDSFRVTQPSGKGSFP